MIAVALALAAAAPGRTPDRPLALRIAALVNGYRRAHGLPPVVLSPSLTAVAEAHVRDVAASADGGASPMRGRGPGRVLCNLHSWSGAAASLPLCYTGDERSAEGMWAKPTEITRGTYSAPGYEIAFWTSAVAGAEAALAGWRSSPDHNAVILELGMWEGSNWQAMGVAAGGHCAFVWFGEAPDPALRSRSMAVPKATPASVARSGRGPAQTAGRAPPGAEP